MCICLIRMVDVKIPGHFQRTNTTLVSDLILFMIYQDGRLEDPWSLSTDQHNFKIKTKGCLCVIRMLDLKIPGCFQRTNMPSKSELKSLSFYQDGVAFNGLIYFCSCFSGRFEGPWSLQTVQRDCKIWPKFVHVLSVCSTSRSLVAFSGPTHLRTPS